MLPLRCAGRIVQNAVSVTSAIQPGTGHAFPPPAPPRAAAGAWWPLLLNLVAPGAGLAWLGRLIDGWLVGLAGALTANLAIWAFMILPDETTATGRRTLLLLALLVFVLAQVLYAQAVRDAARRRSEHVRRGALSHSRRLLECGDAQGAWMALSPALGHDADDLLLAYRAAQVLTAAGDVDRARHAWQRVRRLDGHRIYRAQIAEAQARLTRRAGGKADPV